MHGQNFSDLIFFPVWSQGGRIIARRGYPAELLDMGTLIVVY